MCLAPAGLKGAASWIWILRRSAGKYRISAEPQVVMCGFPLAKAQSAALTLKPCCAAAKPTAQNHEWRKCAAQPANLEAKTRFSELKASLVLRHGVASNSDLAVTAGVLKLAGNGQFDLGVGSIDYTIKASANPKVPELADIAGLILPINFSGQFSAPEYKVDYAGLREQIMARQQAAAAAKASKPAAVKTPAKQSVKPSKMKK